MNSAKKLKLAERRWIPDGFHFLGPEETKNRRVLLAGLMQIFENHNYSEITLPSFDYSSSFHSHLGASESASILRARDWDGYELSPSVDITLQVVKGMAARSHWEENQNVYYVGRKIRDHKKRNASRREILQIGGESIGNSSIGNILSQIQILEKLWLFATEKERVSFALGHAGLLSLVTEILGWEEEWEEITAQLLFTKNHTELINLASRKNTDSHSIEILKLFLKPVSFSGFEEFKKTFLSFDFASDQKKKAETYLNEVSALIKEWQKANVSFSGVWDPALIRDVNYYTGIVFQGYREGHSEPVFAGGVYDGLYETYTELKKEACGFALHIDPIEEVFSAKVR
ncbi:ATP phosphoribosyltransferase regulatory subunit [Leptospira kobayashii]|uniref:ATP phosphoribosyltransferase regulatory subunit n=1 Tax=Leptospira kobayashii TaxID=1917830 RepID=A0ABM7UJY3_9LEPT|nr:ATP phosphoribosyltransferase regulatory subunit [Leptospira kobayashii]BDA79091.1 ATP phosphoribosyltransferase regulatory subunit [Leptospira kobayashii]